MHYKNGREAKIGDEIVVRNWNGQRYTAVVVARPTPHSCDLLVVPLPINNGFTVNGRECLHVEDGIRLTDSTPEPAAA